MNVILRIAACYRLCKKLYSLYKVEYNLVQQGTLESKLAKLTKDVETVKSDLESLKKS